MKTILVPTDFSQASLNAAEYAANLAAHIHAKIILLNVYHKPILVTDKPGVITDPDKLEHEIEARLKTEAQRLVQATGVTVKYKVKRGFVVDAILEEEKNASLVVMGIKLAGQLSETFVGSLATDTIHRSVKPILTIPENATFKAPLKIVFACDYNENTNVNTLNALKEIVKSFGSVVYVLNIGEQEMALAESDIYKKVENKLINVKHINAFAGSGNLAEGIKHFIVEHDADMLTVIPHHYNLLDRLFHASTSTKMAHRATVPVLALPENYASVAGYVL